MKAIKRTLAILITALMILAMVPAAFADGTANITVNGSVDNSVSVSGKTLTAYKIFSAAGEGINISYT